MIGYLGEWPDDAGAGVCDAGAVGVLATGAVVADAVAGAVADAGVGAGAGAGAGEAPFVRVVPRKDPCVLLCASRP
jgi:hypothetical protein